MKITLFDEQEKEKLTPKLEDAVNRTLDAVAVEMGMEFCVNVLLTDNEGIRRLNAEFRGIDRETDVLSFPAYELSALLTECIKELETEEEDGLVFIGDIAISLEKAKQQAGEYGHGMVRETAFLALHGTLHLFGYDHVEPGDEQAMQNKQRQILAQVSIGREIDSE